MKKILFIISIFSLLIIFIPIFLVRKEPENIVIEDAKEEPKYDYKQYNNMRVLHVKTNSVEEINLDDYLLGVVSAEMPANYEQEALNAQAVVARTYTIYSIEHNKNKHENADICDDSNCCQAWISKDNRLERWDEDKRDEYWKKIENAVKNTKGKIITYNGEVIDAFFHSNSGGYTEIPANVWGGTGYPYLQTVQTSGEEAYSQYQSEVKISKNDFINKIKNKHNNFYINFNDKDCIKVVELTESNRVKTLKIGNIEISGVEMRTLLGLKSANFTFEINGDDLIFKVIGYGHGVGMSQTGADSLAKQGYNYEEIIKHFYKDVEVNCIF